MKQSLLVKFIGVGFALLFVFLHRAQAANFLIPCGDTAALVSAINTANDNGIADTIDLAAGCIYAFTTGDATNDDSALPRITTPIVINGNGATIERADGSPYFRLLHVTASGSLSLNNVIVSGGYTYNELLGGGSNGGSILNDGGVLQVRDSTITRNVGLVGGAIYSSGTTTLIDSAVTDSNAVDGGGGIRSNTGTLAIINSTIAGNGTNNVGGGISSNDSTLTVINSQLTGNAANLEGGAFYSVGDVLTVINSTIAGNAAEFIAPQNAGGGIYAEDSTLSVTNSIVWGNSMQINTVGGTVTVVHSIVEGGFSGTGNLDADPLFVAPISYTVAATWPTADGDYHLQADSSAMNAGNSAALPPDTHDIDGDGNTTEPLPTDIDGDWRILDSVVDMGADEASGCAAYIFPYTVAAGDTAELVQAIRCANANPDMSVISLTNSTYTFTTWYADNLDNSLPLITTPVVIEGNDATFRRNSYAYFRLLQITKTGSLMLDAVTIIGGVHGGAVGIPGGVFFNNGGILTITNSSITDSRTSGTGGVIFNNGGRVTVSNSTLSNNRASSSSGAISNARLGTLTVINSTISGNYAFDNGGIHNSGTAMVINSTIVGNRAHIDGGGITNSFTGVVTVINSTISGNYANRGGGIRLFDGTVRVLNSTISGNVGGGLVRDAGTMIVTNSIIWGNDSQIQGTATVTNSIIQGGFGGTGNLTANPLFVSAVSHTLAPTSAGDYRLQADSPALNIGSNVALPQDTFDLDGDNDVIEPVPFDLDGNSRIVNSTVDIGAYEHQTLAGVTISKADMTVTEVGTTDTYTIRLNSRPSANVTIDLSTGSQATASPDLLTFTLSNWSVAQTVTVTAVNDDIMDGTQSDTIDHSVESTDVAYDGMTVGSISISVTDDDTAGVTVEPTVAVIEGGATDTYAVVLSSEPIADVTITPTGDADCSVSNALTFTNVDWDTLQNVTVTAVDDDIAEGPHGCTITNTAASSDLNYNGITVANVAGTVTDNESAGVSVGQTVDVTEGGTTDTYTVILTSKPSASVTITPAGDTQCTVSAALTFTDVDWDIPQAVTATAVDDDIAEGSHACVIINAAASSDPDYNGVTVASIDVTITDNDTAGVNVSQPTVSVTEGGATVTYNVVLTSKPTSDVTITPTGDEQCTTSAVLTFTNLDWDIPQPVTVTAVDDQALEGTHTCHVAHSSASLDPNYDGITIPSVTVSVTDNELNLLANGDFELYDGNKRPASWTVKYPAGDKVKCNTLDKTVSFTGICAFKFKGGPGERAKLIQNVNLSGVTFSQNDTLRLSAYFKGGTAVKATLILNVRYVGNPVPVKVKTAVGSNIIYTGISVPELSIEAAAIQQIKVIIRHNSPAGKLFVDAATLSLAKGPIVRSNVLPLPEAPDGFRGGN